jgi:transmembrane 9 superfamily protein 2/4
MKLVLSLALSVILGTAIIVLNSSKEAPRSYRLGESIAANVNSMTSFIGVMPFGHYSVKTCVPRTLEAKRLSLGDLIVGNRVESSNFEFEVNHNVSCRRLCDSVPMGPDDMQLLVDRIEQQYRGNLLLDSLPVIERRADSGTPWPTFFGYPLGVPATAAGPHQKTLINNHLQFTVAIERDSVDSATDGIDFRIVGFYVTPFSVDYSNGRECTSNGRSVSSTYNPPITSDTPAITWTYGVDWVEDTQSRLTWATRWKAYIREGADVNQIQWFSFINSLMVLVLLVAMVALNLIRMRRKRTAYQPLSQSRQSAKALESDTKWKLLFNDAFRPPAALELLAALVGYGVHLGGLLISGLAFFWLASPLNRGAGLLTAELVLFMVLSFVSGCVASKVLAFCGVQAKRSHPVLMGAGFSAAILGLYLILNYVQYSHGATTGLPLHAVIVVVTLTLAGAAPLFILGFYCGAKKPPIQSSINPESATELSPPPREIPPKKWFLRLWFTVAEAGILSFGSCFIQFYFSLSSLWGGAPYIHVGFAVIAFMLFTTTTAAMSVLTTSMQLNAEDYKWWWSSWLRGAGAGLFFFLYSIYFDVTKLRIDHTAGTILYIGYMAMISTFIGLYAGAVGFLASWGFVCKLYTAFSDEQSQVDEADVEAPNEPHPGAALEDQPASTVPSLPLEVTVEKQVTTGTVVDGSQLHPAVDITMPI